MSAGRLIIDRPGDEPVVMEFAVHDEKDSITIEVTPTEVKVHTPNEPKVVTT